MAELNAAPCYKSELMTINQPPSGNGTYNGHTLVSLRDDDLLEI